MITYDNTSVFFLVQPDEIELCGACIIKTMLQEGLIDYNILCAHTARLPLWKQTWSMCVFSYLYA